MLLFFHNNAIVSDTQFRLFRLVDDYISLRK